jgi:cell wall-associated NlpC family hydrolase
VLPPSLLRKPSTAPVTRAEFVAALARLDARSARSTHRSPLLRRAMASPSLPDAPSGSANARAIALGWLTPVDGRFAGRSPITANEASRGIVGALGLRDSALAFALRLQAIAPDANISYYDAAAQVYARTLGLRYNHLQGSEQLEVGPTETMSVAHVAYMVGHAAAIPAWKRTSLRAYEQMTLPTLGANQRTVVLAALGLVGQPYVWAGETEGPQPEGHGGFDCSGFVWRTLLNSGVPADQRDAVTGRSSMAMSAEGARIYDRAALQPGDVIFFGSSGASSSPDANFHAALWLGNGWFIHSSGSNDGVSITHLDGWWSDRFSWGRRVLLAP